MQEKKMPAATENRRDDAAAAGSSARTAFPIVAIGASAGGLEALRLLFEGIAHDTGMAFVVIQHLDPDRPSMLSGVLAKDVRMPVIEVSASMRAEPNHVYVIPAHADLSIHDGVFELIPRERTRQLHLPVDLFCRALADDMSGQAIGIVLSGSASDGTEGLRAIKESGGITFAQEPASAQYDGMPQSAIAAGVVDFRLPPQKMGSVLERLSRDDYLVSAAPVDADAGAPVGDDPDSILASILTSVRRHAHLDFRGYKRSTLMRRIARRMAVRRSESVQAYAESIRNDVQECKALGEDILIHVTSFFRDTEAFDALKRKAVPKILANKDDDATIRVWVPGCSTGEEVYSIAMCLFEALDEHDRNPAIKIFGSDLSEAVIDTARSGLYSEKAVEGVSPERRDRFFERAEGSYRITSLIRDCCVFVRHDLAADPPFARLDLISCRNVLIYLGADLQKRILPLFHHCLNKPGFLFLGASESVGEFDDIFTSVDKEHRIFRKTGESLRPEYPLALGYEAESKIPVFHPPQRTTPARDAQRQADHALLARYAPPGVVVNGEFEVVQFRGRTGDFLESPPGQPQTNILKLAREGLRVDLGEALETAKAESTSVHRDAVRLSGDASARLISLKVVPLIGIASEQDPYFLVIFEEASEDVEGGASSAHPQPRRVTRGESEDEVSRLKTELAATRAYVLAVEGEHQDTTEELGAANEEMIAANEELQASNEELQSAKEELQSTNEELSTLNDELNNRNRQLDRVANDLVNVLESVQIPVIIVDQELQIRRFTPTAQQISSLRASDIGRSIEDVKLKVNIDNIEDKIRDTVESVTPKEYEVQGVEGRWYRLHIRPYRTADHRLDGAVLSFLDVDVLKRALEQTERARDYANSIVETVPMSLVVLDGELRIVSANAPFHEEFFPRADLTDHPRLFEVDDGALNVNALRGALDQTLETRSPFQDIQIECTLPRRGRRDLMATGCLIDGTEGDPMILLALEDITERLQLEASETQARLEAEQANQAKDLFLATLGHELRTPLNTILMSSQLLKQLSSDDPRIQRACAATERAVGNQAKLIDDLLDISRIVAGKLMLDLQAVDLASITQSAIDVAQVSAEANGLELVVDIADEVGHVHGDPVRLQQVIANLLHNSIKFTPAGGKITVSLNVIDGMARLVIADTGVGLSPDMIPHLFDRFMQVESSMTRAQGGLGLGLAIVQHIVSVHGGEVHAESPGPGEGTTMTVTLPLASQVLADVSVAPRTVTRSIEGIRVLLVEDDDDTREICAAMLEEKGAVVHSARSVPDGLAALEEFVPHVVLCDIAMPGQDGYSFIRELRDKDKAMSETPVAALTALAGEEDRARALAAGFDMHLAKPIDSDRLATAVATLASREPDVSAQPH